VKQNICPIIQPGFPDKANHVTKPGLTGIRRTLLIGFLGAAVAGLGVVASADGAFKELRVAQNQRYLEYHDGTSFFYLGDTAWELFHRLNREEADRYLKNREAKGFTVIQAVVLAELGGLDDPNPYGHTPLVDKDPARPNEAYFQHVDFIVDRAESLGLVMGMLPTWGNWWKRGDIFTPQNARAYGRFLGERYKDKPIIWILGGDHNPDNDRERALIESMAHGIKEGDGGRHLMTFHPRGPGLSSHYFHEADWLDFNMFQSSHAARDHDTGLFADHDYKLEPPKPTLDGEPRYEGIPVGFYNADADRDLRFDDYDVRQAAYWSLLAGACGHTYGHNSVWQMWQPGRKPVIWASTPWHESLDQPGASQMKHVRHLFESRPFHKLVPDQSILLDAPTHGGAKVRAARATDGSFLFVYSPRGEQFTVRVNVIRTSRIRQTWYDPRTGAAKVLHTTDTPGFQTFVPPTSGRGNDWILVLDDATAGFPAPGQAR